MDRKIGMTYGAADSPQAVFAKRITYVIGPDGKIAQAYPKVDPKSHPKTILETL
jgi:peroxiredoxin